MSPLLTAGPPVAQRGGMMAAAVAAAQEAQVRVTRNIGMLLLAIWLILAGLMALVGFSFPSSTQAMAVLALAAGIAILLGR
ncbi:MAG TPA: hypothetical protein VFN74_22695 [Chloroflexota bacterium]|nr:hypothetical protein [Chloroflexota bacterium]